MEIEFEKWQACLNNFILIWSSKNQSKYLYDSLRRQAHKLCNSDGSGISADGILCLTVEDYSSLLPNELTIINQDGSLAKNCGNGLRCAASSIYNRISKIGKNYDLPEFVDIKVGQHSFMCQFLEKKNYQSIPYTLVDMGDVLLNMNNSWHLESCEEVQNIFHKMNKKISKEDISTCFIQNKHISIFHEEADEFLLEEVGSKLQKSKLWDGINVHIVKEISYDSLSPEEKNNLLPHSGQDIYQMWTWERGVGPTKACGSGACSVASQVFSTGFVSREDVLLIKSSGGIVQVKQSSPDSSVQLLGDAKLAFSGRVDV